MASMRRLQPTHEFQLPSMHDGLLLDCRIYLPAPGPSTARVQGAAVMAHPYASLGGSYDDRIVLATCEGLVQFGYAAGAFNFRGAPGSAGKTSWSSTAELGDYKTFATFLALYVRRLLDRGSTSRQRPLGTGHEEDHANIIADAALDAAMDAPVPPLAATATVSTGNKAADPSDMGGRGAAAAANIASAGSVRNLTIVLGGYSYGSMIASRMPACQELLQTLNQSTESQAWYSKCCNLLDKLLPTTAEPEEVKSDGSSVVIDSNVAPVHIHTAYYLVCPLMAPTSIALSPSWSSVSQLWTSSAKNFASLVQHPTLVVLPDSDMFSSVKMLQRWASRLAKQNANLRYETVEGGDHFWQKPAARQALSAALLRFLRKDLQNQ